MMLLHGLKINTSPEGNGIDSNTICSPNSGIVMRVCFAQSETAVRSHISNRLSARNSAICHEEKPSKAGRINYTLQQIL